jgi:hypothetical protein
MERQSEGSHSQKRQRNRSKKKREKIRGEKKNRLMISAAPELWKSERERARARQREGERERERLMRFASPELHALNRQDKKILLLCL